MSTAAELPGVNLHFNTGFGMASLMALRGPDKATFYAECYGGISTNMVDFHMCFCNCEQPGFPSGVRKLLVNLSTPRVLTYDDRTSQSSQAPQSTTACAYKKIDRTRSYY